MNIGLLYPRISHYREEFFEAILKQHTIDFYIYESLKESSQGNFRNADVEAIEVSSYFLMNKIRLISIMPFIKKKYDVLVLIGEMRSPSIWILLLLAKLTKTKTILWGHGISVHSYLEEEKKLNPLRVIFHKLADHNWLYTDNEVNLWTKHISSNKLTSLNNTIDIDEILNEPLHDKSTLKAKHNIKTKINFIYCARFAGEFRRIDLMIETIEKTDPNKYGFIIIGDGDIKPDFSKYANVYDFGTVYDRATKTELFQIADIYFQPGWVGLSGNEALAYGKMILTFKRSKEVKQCVEYAYLTEKNSYSAKNIPDLLNFIENLDSEKIETYGQEARNYAKNNLRLETMVTRALESLIKFDSKTH